LRTVQVGFAVTGYGYGPLFHRLSYKLVPVVDKAPDSDEEGTGFDLFGIATKPP
jgi:hypothetical protein